MKVPTYISRGQASVPAAPFADTSAMAAPSTTLAQAGRNISAVASHLGEISLAIEEKIRDAEDLTALSSAKVRATKVRNDVLLRLSDETDPLAIPIRYKEETAKAYEEIRQELSPRVQSSFNAWNAMDDETHFMIAAQMSRKKRINQILATGTTAFDEAVKMGKRDLMESAAEAMFQSNAIDADRKREMLKNGYRLADYWLATVAVQTDPASAIIELNKPSEFPDLDPIHRATLLERAKREVKADNISRYHEFLTQSFSGPTGEIDFDAAVKEAMKPKVYREKGLTAEEAGQVSNLLQNERTRTLADKKEKQSDLANQYLKEYVGIMLKREPVAPWMRKVADAVAQGLVDDSLLKYAITAQKQEKAAAKAATALERSLNPFLRSNPVVAAHWITLSIADPEKVDIDGARGLVGNGLSFTDFEKVVNNVKKGEKSVWRSPMGASASRRLDQYRKNHKFSTDEKENEGEYLKTLSHMQIFFEKNPNAKAEDISKEIDSQMKPYLIKWYESAWEWWSDKVTWGK